MKILASIYPVLMIAAAMLTSCTQVVDVTLKDQQNKVVIEGYLSSETDSSYLLLSRTADYFGSADPEMITNATVEITDGSSLFMFNHVADGMYKSVAGFKGEPGTTYSLKVIADGASYTSVSKLHPMFDLDTALRLDYRPAEPPLTEEGYAVTYFSNDTRPELVYTKFNFGQNDTLFEQNIVFSNADIKKNQYVPFELPFFRPRTGDSIMLIFRSMEKPVADYLNALDVLRSGAPGPFRTPPANPPTNISGGALGYFMATDVKRIGKVLP